MNLSFDMKKHLTDEVAFGLERMRDSEDAATKLYFFSTVYGAAFRVMNIEFDPELAFIHHVTQAAHSMIDARLSRLLQGQEKAVAIPKKLFDRLEEALGEMLVKIERGEDTYLVLQRIFNLAYSTTGNGYYLYLKGMLPV